MLQRFTDSARAIIKGAFREVERRGHQFLCVGHLIAGLLEENSVVSLLNTLGADVVLVRSQLNAQLEQLTKPVGGSRKILVEAIHEANKRNHSVIDAEHIALSLLADPDGTFRSVLTGAGMDVETFRDSLVNGLKHHPVSSLPTEAVLREIPELRTLFLQLDRQQEFKEEAIVQQDFQTAAKYRVETDRLKREIEKASSVFVKHNRALVPATRIGSGDDIAA